MSIITDLTKAVKAGDSHWCGACVKLLRIEVNPSKFDIIDKDVIDEPDID